MPLSKKEAYRPLFAYTLSQSHHVLTKFTKSGGMVAAHTLLQKIIYCRYGSQISHWHSDIFENPQFQRYSRTRNVNCSCRYDRGDIYCTLVPIYFIAVSATRVMSKMTRGIQPYLMERAVATPSAETPIERRYSAIFLSRASFFSRSLSSPTLMKCSANVS